MNHIKTPMQVVRGSRLSRRAVVKERPDPKVCIECGKVALYKFRTLGFCRTHYAHAQGLTVTYNVNRNIRHDNARDAKNLISDQWVKKGKPQ